MSDPACIDNAEFECILQLLMDLTPAEMTKYSRMAAKGQGISEEIATGVAKLKEMAARSKLPGYQRQHLCNHVQVR